MKPSNADEQVGEMLGRGEPIYGWHECSAMSQVSPNTF